MEANQVREYLEKEAELELMEVPARARTPTHNPNVCAIADVCEKKNHHIICVMVPAGPDVQL